MNAVRRLPTVISVSRAHTSASDVTDPSITFELETHTGETFEIQFSLKSMLAASVMALNWDPLRSELASLPKPDFRHGRSREPLVLY